MIRLRPSISPSCCLGDFYSSTSSSDAFCVSQTSTGTRLIMTVPTHSDLVSITGALIVSSFLLTCIMLTILINILKSLTLKMSAITTKSLVSTLSSSLSSSFPRHSIPSSSSSYSYRSWAFDRLINQWSPRRIVHEEPLDLLTSETRRFNEVTTNCSLSQARAALQSYHDNLLHYLNEFR